MRTRTPNLFCAILAIVAALVWPASVQPARAASTWSDNVSVDDDGLLLYPMDFFDLNAAAMVEALEAAGFQPSGGSTNTIIGINASTVTAPILTNSARLTVAANGSLISYDLVAGSITTNYLASTVFDWLSATFQGLDTDLTDLADGSLTGSKVGTGINADNITTGTVGAARIDSTMATDAEMSAAVAGLQAADADLTDLADGSLTGSKVGSGINADNITTGTVGAARIDSTMATDAEVSAAVAGLQASDADLADLADGSLTGSKVGSGINADNITTGTVADARIPSTIARTNAPTLHNATLLGTNSFESAIFGAAVISNLTGNASGLTNLNASELRSGTIPTNRLDSNTAQLAVAGSTGTGAFMRTRTGIPRTVWIPASAMNPGTDAPAAVTNAWSTTTDGQRWEGWDFSATVTNSVYFTLQLPDAWDAGTVKAKVVWKQATAAATSTNVWAIGGGSMAGNETAGNTLGTLVTVIEPGLNDTEKLSISPASSAITIGGSPAAGHLTWFTIRRHPGNVWDNSAVLGRLIGVLLQYTESITEPSAW